MRITRAACLMLGVSVAGLHASTAAAQSGPADEQGQEAQAPQGERGAPSAQESQGGSGLGDIIVTARRVAENVQNTPVAVSIFSNETLARAQISGTEGLSALVPSLQIAGAAPNVGNPSAAQIFIRGIGQSDTTPGVDPGVGLYIDDVYMGSAIGGIMDFRDIANVQVLRGPQGTLFGRNTIGGAILLTTKEPGDHLGGEARIGVGSDNLREARVAIDVPLSDDLRTRWTYGGRNRDGYVHRISDGLDLGDVNSYTITGKIQWKPGTDFKLTLKGDYTAEHSNGTALVLAALNPNAPYEKSVSFYAGCPGMTSAQSPVPLINDPRCANDFYKGGPFKTNGTYPLGSTLRNWGVTAAAEYDVGKALTFKSITAYRDLKWTGSRDADGTPFAISASTASGDGWQFSQELQAIVHVKDLTIVSGAYYFESKTDFRFLANLTNDAPPDGTIDHWDGLYHNSNWAVFSQGTLDITHALQVTGGIRYTEETKKFFPNQYREGDYDDPYVPRREYRVKTGAVTGTAAIQYRFSDDIMTYVSWTKGYKAGGFNRGYPAPVPAARSFAPEYATAWEAGTKLDLFDRKVRLNLAAFSTDYNDLQLLYRVGIIPTIINAGKARIRGLEGELTIKPAEGWLLTGNGSILDDKILEVVTIPGSSTAVSTNSRLPYVPHFQGQFASQYTFVRPIGDFDLSIRGSVNYIGSQYFDVGNSPNIAQLRNITMFDIGLTLDNAARGWLIQAGIKNLSNEVYQIAGNGAYNTPGGYDEVAYNRGREWTLSVTKTF